jgi:flagellar basal-body rod modification protein FlgD
MSVTEITSTGTSTPPADMITASADSTNQADFLQMLVAQLTNQDPLSPLEGTEFASQLAQFSSLEELQKMNSGLAGNLEANLILTQSINNSLATMLIGKTIRADMQSVNLGESGSASVQFQLDEAAADVTIEIIDENGETIRTLSETNLPEGENSVAWNGYDDAGNRMAAGEYTVKVTAKDADGENIATTLFFEGRVTGIEYQDGIAVLLVGTREVNLGDVISISDSENDAEYIPV